ncbi:hypothetical protein FA13DRAFT_204649 [Coprinellus micaceus]|uniref:HMG box domain-containing protein n=1 Tax=Coprinellus micaceus TaxID=71717 RepID=A0A4Y7SFW0_COPMI|nr:hypothetical protein FA13DRAFT_204649 [Coprinellus micaceus]
MPAFRNVSRHQGRSSARLGHRVPVGYDSEGWEVPVGETLQSLCLSPGTSPHPIPPHLERASTPLTSTKSNPQANSTRSEVKPSVASNGGSGRPRSVSVASTTSSTSSSSSPPSSPRLPSTMTTTKNRSKPYASKTSSKGDDHVRRPRNAFIVFRSHFNKKIEAQRFIEGPKMNQNTVSRDAGHAWRALPESQKDYYRRLAKQESDEHKRNHPGYRYAPHGHKKPAASKSKSTSRGKGKGKKAAKDSDEESDPEFDAERSVHTPESPLRRSTRSRPSVRRYTSPSPSIRSASPTPSATNSVSTQESYDEAPTDDENEFVATEDIPTIELTPGELEKDEPQTPVFAQTSEFDRREIPAFMDNTEYIFGVGAINKTDVRLRTVGYDAFFGDASPTETFDMDVQLPEASSPSEVFPTASFSDMGPCGYDANDPWATELSSTTDNLMDMYLDTSLCD